MIQIDGSSGKVISLENHAAHHARPDSSVSERGVRMADSVGSESGVLGAGFRDRGTGLTAGAGRIMNPRRRGIRMAAPVGQGVLASGPDRHRHGPFLNATCR